VGGRTVTDRPSADEWVEDATVADMPTRPTLHARRVDDDDRVGLDDRLFSEPAIVATKDSFVPVER
jgi:hypothetical protein